MNKLSIIKKTCQITVVIFLTAFILFPPALYEYTLSGIKNMPEKSSVRLSQHQVQEFWNANEKCHPRQCASTTPYWIYSWLFLAITDGHIVPVSEDNLSDSLSKMSTVIARRHLLHGNLERNGMLWWHLSSLYLGIWIQRNWSASEIAEKYANNDA